MIDNIMGNVIGIDQEAYDKLVSPDADCLYTVTGTGTSWTSTNETQVSIDNDKVSFNVDGEWITLSGKEVKRIKQILMEQFPEDYI